MSFRKRKAEHLDIEAIDVMEEFADIYETSGFSTKEGYPSMEQLIFHYGYGNCQLACFTKDKHQEFIDYLKTLNKYDIQEIGKDAIDGLDKAFPKGSYVINIKYTFE